MRTALSGGVDRGTAEGGDDGRDGDGCRGFARSPAAGRGLGWTPYLVLGADLFGGHATTVQAVHVSPLCVVSASVMSARLHSCHIDKAQSELMGATNNERVSSPSGYTVNENEPARVVMRRADGKPIHVLVVDDEPVLAELVSMALRYEGWEIATAGDGVSAIASARETPPDVVVLDVMLPDMSGLEVLQQAARADRADCRVLLLTAKDSVKTASPA